MKKLLTVAHLALSVLTLSAGGSNEKIATYVHHSSSQIPKSRFILNQSSSKVSGEVPTASIQNTKDILPLPQKDEKSKVVSKSFGNRSPKKASSLTNILDGDFTKFGSTSSSDVTGPYNLSNGNIMAQYQPSGLTDYMYGLNLYGRQGYALLRQNSGTDNGLFFTDLDGTQDISVELDVASLVAAGGYLQFLVYDSQTGELIGTDEYGKLDGGVAYTVTTGFAEIGHKRVTLQVKSKDGSFMLIFGGTITAAFYENCVGTPSAVSYSINNDVNGFSISNNSARNSNYTRALLYHEYTPTSNLSQYSLFSQNFNSITNSGTSYTDPDASQCYECRTIPEIPEGNVFHMVKRNGQIGFHVLGNWISSEESYRPGFQTYPFNLTATNGAATVSFKYRTTNTQVYYIISRYIWSNKINNFYEYDARLLGYKDYSSVMNSTYGYANQDYTFSYDFPEVSAADIAKYDLELGDVMFAVQALAYSNVNNVYYAWIDDLDISVKNVQAGKTLFYLKEVKEIPTNSSNPITFDNINLRDNQSNYYFTLEGVSKDAKFDKEFKGAYYLENEYYVPVIVPAPAAPTFKIGDTNYNPNTEATKYTVKTTDVITITGEAGSTIEGQFVASTGRNSDLTLSGNTATWPVNGKDGYIKAKAVNAGGESEEVYFYFTVAKAVAPTITADCANYVNGDVNEEFDADVITLTFSEARGQKVYYSIDVSEPTTEYDKNNKPKLTNAHDNAVITVKAVAKGTGMLDSEVAVAKYSFPELVATKDASDSDNPNTWVLTGRGHLKNTIASSDELALWYDARGIEFVEGVINRIDVANTNAHIVVLEDNKDDVAVGAGNNLVTTVTKESNPSEGVKAEVMTLVDENVFDFTHNVVCDNITYTRDNSYTWVSAIFPFATKAQTIEVGGKELSLVYMFEGFNGSDVNYVPLANEEVIPAYTPVIILANQAEVELAGKDVVANPGEGEYNLTQARTRGGELISNFYFAYTTLPMTAQIGNVDAFAGKSLYAYVTQNGIENEDCMFLNLGTGVNLTLNPFRVVFLLASEGGNGAAAKRHASSSLGITINGVPIEDYLGNGSSGVDLNAVDAENAPSILYNIQGQRVGSNYRGVVIDNGVKRVNK